MSTTVRSAPETFEGVTSAVKERTWAIVVWGGMVAWSCALFAVVRDGYLSFRLGRYDFGNMVQAVWSTVDGRMLETTNGATGEQVSRLGVHVDPMLVLLSPLWMVWPSPLVLALAQIVVVSLGALPVFWLGRRHLGSEPIATLLAFGYLAYPWVVTSTASAIHPVTFAVPLLLYCVWFLDTKRLLLFGVCAVLVLSTGELMGLPIAGLGVWYAFARGRRLAGATIGALGLMWTVVAVYVVVPAAQGGATSRYYGFYDQVGGSPHGVVRMLVTDPGTVLGALLEVPDFAYLLWLAIPLCGLFLLSPGLAAIGLPQLLANMLSDFPSMTDPRYHSVDAVVPFLIGATVLGIARISAPRRSLAAAAVLVSSTLLAVVVGPWPRLVGVAPLGGRQAYTDVHIKTLRDALTLIPSDAAVVSTTDLGGHLSARRYVYTVPVMGTASWAVLDLDDPWATRPDSPLLHRHPAVVRQLARRLERDDAWQKVYERGSVLVFRRTD